MELEKDAWTEMEKTWAQRIAPDSPSLNEFCCRLLAHAKEGNLCMRYNETWVSSQIWTAAADDLSPFCPIIRDHDRYYIQRNWVLETTIIRHLRRLMAATPRVIPPIHLSAQLEPRQAQAVESVYRNTLTVVSGGPGTGKSFTAAEAIRSLGQSQCSPFRVLIAAPTGKAADRLAQGVEKTESSQVEAMTLHRLLGLQPGRNKLFHQTAYASGPREKKIDADLIIVDEASMIDAALFAHLLAAVPDGARLMLLGDADQLPPINGGGIFADLSSLFAIRLEACHRTQNEAIRALFLAAQMGHVNPLDMVLEPLPRDLVSWIEPMLGPLVFNERPHPQSLVDRFNQLRIICPLRQGPVGVDAINSALLKRLQSKLRSGQWWGAPILITNNDQNLEVFNGTSGIIVGQYSHGAIPSGLEEAFLSDGRSFRLNRLPSYEIAFALSIHKSQGSEFDEVVCCLPPGSEEFAREGLYTAITRAKKSIRLAGEKKILELMLAVRSRHENGICERLKGDLNLNL